MDTRQQRARIRISTAPRVGRPAGAEKLCSDCRCVEIWREFWCDVTELPSCLVDRHKGRLRFHRFWGPNVGNSCRRMWKKEIVRVKKDQDRIAGEWPGTVRCDDLTSVLLSEHGPDPVPILGDYPSGVICRAIVDDDDFANRMVLAKSTIDRRPQKIRVVVIDYDDAHPPSLGHGEALPA